MTVPSSSFLSSFPSAEAWWEWESVMLGKAAADWINRIVRLVTIQSVCCSCCCILRISSPLSPYSAYKLYSIFHATFSEFVCFGADDHIDPAKLLTFFFFKEKNMSPACSVLIANWEYPLGIYLYVVLIRFNWRSASFSLYIRMCAAGNFLWVEPI